MLVEYFVHVDGIFLSTWRIFNLHGKNIFKRFYDVHKILAHRSQAHRSCSCAHTIATLLCI
jgi:hypothetical protein